MRIRFTSVRLSSKTGEIKEVLSGNVEELNFIAD